MLSSAATATIVTTRRRDWLGEGRDSNHNFMGSFSTTELAFTGRRTAQWRERRIDHVQLRTAKICRKEDERGLSTIRKVERQPRLAILALCPAVVKSPYRAMHNVTGGKAVKPFKM